MKYLLNTEQKKTFEKRPIRSGSPNMFLLNARFI